MKGKAQLILTDPDSGRVIKRVEESNMVTNAIQRIFDIPQVGILRGDSCQMYSGFMPIYKNLMSGLIMLGNNVNENPDKFMIPDDSIFVGSAGTEYTGTLSTRGTLNTSQSGEIENGYRFVWDFAPEKAVGTINCIGLTNVLFGNGGFDLQRTDGYIMVNPQDFDFIGRSNPEYASVKGTPLGYLDGNDTMYSVIVYQNTATVYQCRIPDCGAIRLEDCEESFYDTKVIRKDEYSLPIYANSYRSWAFDKENNWLYVFNASYSYYTETETVEYCAIDIKTGKTKKTGEINWSPKSSTGLCYYAVCDNKIYISEHGDMRAFSLSGEQLEAIDFGPETVTSAIPMFSGGRKSVLIEDSSIGGRHYTYLGREPKIFIESPDYLQSLDWLKLPYVVSYNISDYETNTLYIMLRTDYLATINNLAEPLVKTDRHALQVRYEITNE